MKRINLDHAATTPLAPTVREAMLPWLDASNPSSQYESGRRAKSAIDSAREAISSTIGSLFAESLFTSGGTESAHAALLGLALASLDSPRRRILLGASEHACVLACAGALEPLGFSVELVPVDSAGRIDRDVLENQLDDRVLVVAAMHANNELGTFNPIASIAEQVHRHGALLFCDAVQTAAESWTVDELRADLVSLSAHKAFGPKGVGLLYVRAGTQLKPVVGGGGQERELRGGTENVAGIVGFGAALSYARSRPRHADARDRFESKLQEHGATLSVSGAERLPTHAHVRFPGIDAETILIRLDRAGIEASSGAACSSGSAEPSHVLLAAGWSAASAREGLRFTFSGQESVDEAEEAARRVVQVVGEIRAARS